MIKLDVEQIWKTEDWASQARNFVIKLKEFPYHSKIVLVLRHSHRNEPKRLEEMRKLRLTPRGHAIAKRFGEALPIDRKIRLFHSIIKRCEETAENIHNGFKNVGGESKIIGEFTPLYNLGITNLDFFI